MARGRRLFRVLLGPRYLRQFQMAQPFRMVRGHHLYRANLGLLTRPLFRKDLLFLTDPDFHLFRVTLDRHFHRGFH